MEIDAKGMKVADLNENQLSELLNAEAKLNKGGAADGEIYLLAVTRH